MIENCKKALRNPRLVTELGYFDLGFLVATDRVKLMPAREAFAGLVKADTASLPAFFAESTLLSNIVVKQWRTESKEGFAKLEEVVSIEEGSIKVNEQTHKVATILLKQAGYRTATAIAPKVEAILEKVQKKSKKAFFKQAKLAAKDGLITLENWEKWVAQSTENQIDSFVKRYPDRILAPQIETQLRDIQERPDKHSQIAMMQYRERLDRLAEKDPYWDTMTSVEVSTLWHAEGILQARDKNFATYQIINPMDKKTCPVCKRLHGLVYKVEDAYQRVMQWAALTDPDEIATVFPFPRFADVDRENNLTMDDLKARGFLLPPFHGRCRDEIQLLTRGTETGTPSASVTALTPQKPSTPGLLPQKPVKPQVGDTLAPGWTLKGKDYVAFDYPEPFKDKKEALAWVRANLAENVSGVANKTLEEINNALSPLRVVMTQAPLKEKLYALSFDAHLTDANGVFTPGVASGRNTIKLQDGLPANQRYADIDAYKAKLSKILKQSEDFKISWLEGRSFDELSESDQKFLNELDEMVKYNKYKLKELESKGLSRHYSENMWSVSEVMADNQSAGTLIHEYAHAWHYENGSEVNPFFQLPTPENNDAPFQWIKNRRAWRDEFGAYRVSGYSVQDSYWCEVFAENFSMYMHGAVKHMHPDMIKFFDSKFPALDFGHKLRSEIYA